MLIHVPPGVSVLAVDVHKNTVSTAVLEPGSSGLAQGQRVGVIRVATRRMGSDHVAIDVADNGRGIKSEDLPRIFDPFFTTKDVGKGTGLGLTIAYKIVSQHGGRIDVHTEVGVGSTFTVVLPIDPPAEAAPAEEREGALA